MRVKILVVDDSARIRTQVSLALTQAGFSILEAVDGVDALQKLADAPEVALVVCDVNMPNMNGLEFLERVRGLRSFNDLPVIMLTTEDQSYRVARAQARGAKAWIIKPFKPDLLIAAAKKLTAAT